MGLRGLLLIVLVGLFSSALGGAHAQMRVVASIDQDFQKAVVAEVETALREWVASLRRRDLRAHMDHYDQHVFIYFTWRNVSWNAVYADKRRFMAAYPTVRVYAIRNVAITLKEGVLATAEFDKRWDFRTKRGGRFAGGSWQRLALVRTREGWKIVSEAEPRVYWVVRP